MGSSSGKKHKKDKKHTHRSRSRERQHRSVEEDVTLDLTDDSSSTRHRHHKHKKHKEHRHKHHKHKEQRPSEVISLEESDSDSKCSQRAFTIILLVQPTRKGQLRTRPSKSTKTKSDGFEWTLDCSCRAIALVLHCFCSEFTKVLLFFFFSHFLFCRWADGECECVEERSRTTC